MKSRSTQLLSILVRIIEHKLFEVVNVDLKKENKKQKKKALKTRKQNDMNKNSALQATNYRLKVKKDEWTQHLEPVCLASHCASHQDTLCIFTLSGRIYVFQKFLFQNIFYPIFFSDGVGGHKFPNISVRKKFTAYLFVFLELV